MQTLRIVAINFEDFSRQVREFREAHPEAVGLDDDKLTRLWSHIHIDKKRPADFTLITVFYSTAQ